MADADLECEAMMRLFLRVRARLSLDLTRLARLVFGGVVYSWRAFPFVSGALAMMQQRDIFKTDGHVIRNNYKCRHFFERSETRKSYAF